MAATKLDSSNPDDADIIQDVLSLYTECFQPLGLTDLEMIHASRMFAAAMHGFLQSELSGLFVRSYPLDESYDWMITRLIEGLKISTTEQ